MSKNETNIGRLILSALVAIVISLPAFAAPGAADKSILGAVTVYSVAGGGAGLTGLEWSNIDNTPVSVSGYGITNAILYSTSDGSGLTGLTWSQIGSTPDSLSGYGITNSVLSATGDGSGLTGLTWSQIGSTPDSLSGYGITNSVLSATGDGSGLTGLTWSQIGSTPTSISGYGITNTLLYTADIGVTVQGWDTDLDKLAKNDGGSLTNVSATGTTVGGYLLTTWEGSSSTVYIVSSDNQTTNAIGTYWN
ncbi:hypothetical protein ACFLQL_00055 [Verrucomicrobiota bacterium]